MHTGMAQKLVRGWVNLQPSFRLCGRGSQVANFSHTIYRVTIQVVPNLLLTSKQKLRFSVRSIYRDRLKSLQILLSRTHPEPGRTGKQEQ